MAQNERLMVPHRHATDPERGPPAPGSVAGLRSCGSPSSTHSQIANVKRARVSNASMSVGLARDELEALLDAAQADRTRSEALITLLAYNGLRIDEALSRDVEHLGHQLGHRVLGISRKGGRDALEPLSPPVERALDRHLAGRTTGPLFLDDHGRRMYEAQARRLVRRLARKAGIKSAGRLSPHSLRHTYATSLGHAGEASPRWRTANRNRRRGAAWGFGLVRVGAGDVQLRVPGPHPLRANGLPLPEVIVDADAVARGKPDPEGYLKAAEALGRRPGDCLALEDGMAGVTAAWAAGMTVWALNVDPDGPEATVADRAYLHLDISWPANPLLQDSLRERTTTLSRP
jgi:hypothetical protein